MTITPPHLCPGNCGRRAPRHDPTASACRFCCHDCWDRLPLGLRKDLVSSHDDTVQVRHLLLVGDATSWFGRHPLKKRPKVTDDWLAEMEAS